MTKKFRTHCYNCKKSTTHTLKKITHKNKKRKINIKQFNISLKSKSKAGKILKKLVQNQHIALLKCHICNITQSIECHVIKKKQVK